MSVKDICWNMTPFLLGLHCFLLVYSWVKVLTSVQFWVEELGMIRCTFVDYNSYVHEIYTENLLCYPFQIGSSRKIVEINITVFSICRYNWRRLESWSSIVWNQTSFPLCGALELWHTMSSQIFSDLWRAYSHILEIDDYNFQHRTMNHNFEFYNSKAEKAHGSV